MVTELGIIVFLQPAISSFVEVSIIALQLSRESYFLLLFSTIIEVKPLQNKNASSPIVATELGIVIDVKPLQYENALEPIVATELGIVIDVKPLQP